MTLRETDKMMKVIPCFQLTVNIFQRIGSSAAVSSADGDKLFVVIEKAFEKGMVVVLDFNNIDSITPTFLNAAIGQLYSKYESPFLNLYLEVKNIKEEDEALLRKVVKNAKRYFKDKRRKEA